MIHSVKRIGNFTSSNIEKLMSDGKKSGEYGKPYYTYIQEKNMERRLGRSLNDIASAKPLIWGKFLEARAFELLGMEYRLVSQDTIQHPLYDYWSGSPDGIKLNPNTVIDIKCPMTLKSFCKFVDCITLNPDGSMNGTLTINKIRAMHDDGEKYYWQLVSNAILTNSNSAELIIYLPYKSELQEIRDYCEETDMAPNKIAWIAFAEDDDLPYLLDGGFYKNIYTFNFEVPENDKRLLTDRVITAGKHLIKRPNGI